MNISAILCADWAKEQRKRAVFVADIGARTVSRIARADWSVAKVLDAAQPWAERGPVLVAFDAPLGARLVIWSPASRSPLWQAPQWRGRADIVRPSGRSGWRGPVS
jgi:hypothetical protein